VQSKSIRSSLNSSLTLGAIRAAVLRVPAAAGQGDVVLVQGGGMARTPGPASPEWQARCAAQGWSNRAESRGRAS
jgi:hypothetical protein